MSKPTSTFVSILSIFVFLSLTIAACSGSSIPSSTASPPPRSRDPVNQVYALAWLPNGTELATW